MTAPSTTVAPVAGSAATQGFVIQGTAFSYDSVARLLSRLALVPDLSNVTLTSTGSGAAPGSSATGDVQFSITAAVKGAPAAPVAPPVVPAPAGTTTTAGA
jgi:hypothetical protein